MVSDCRKDNRSCDIGQFHRGVKMCGAFGVKRAISFVLIVTIALQSFGCSTWRPLARLNDVRENERQASMPDQVVGKLKEGMAVRIRILEGASAPIEEK